MSSLEEQPSSRRLRIFAFDPSLGTRLETSGINEVVIEILWEKDLGEGPRGEYIEVIDVDPSSGAFYEPVNLNAPFLLAQDGLAPSESNPQFHQQMVYAVAMATIRQFERALGRTAMWADRRIKQADGTVIEQFVRRLRIYPHALRERNAYYSPQKKAVLFGYFPVTAKDAFNTPGTLVFTCLSHDIIAHEVTHALLDGVHPRFNEATNPDVHAFHEAFADIVALFQHFSYPIVLESQIRRTHGNLDSENLLTQLAHQFGRATGRGSALRDALGSEVDGVWKTTKPDPQALEKTSGAHARGAILVAAVFRAFLLMYRSRTADLYRIASQGTGNLPEGDIHPDLTKRLAAEASFCADRILQMCIRGIDYCPPVNITFGDFLRAVVTADFDFSPQDKSGFRQVFIESFRGWGIHPRDITNVGWDALIWPTGRELYADLQHRDNGFRHSQESLSPALKQVLKNVAEQWNLETDCFKVWKSLGQIKYKLWSWLRVEGDSFGRDYARLFGLVINDAEAPRTVYRTNHGVAVEIHSVRPTLRRTIDGSIRTDIVVEVTQRRRGYFDKDKQTAMDAAGQLPLTSSETGDFTFRYGATILVDPRTGEIRRVIRTAGTIKTEAELDRVRSFLTGESGVSGNSFDAGLANSLAAAHHGMRDEPFALLHQLQED